MISSIMAKKSEYAAKPYFSGVPQGRAAACQRGERQMARDEARHGKAFEGLLERYFGK